jgi:decaprenylphospho-beta-D-erythro-pentofuranosid-2-ulose 2-reductase
MNQNIIIIGATSGIAEAVARRYAEQGAGLFLVARDKDKLKALSTDLSARGAKNVQTFMMDATDSERIPDMLDAAWKAFVTFDVALVAHGTLPDQQHTEVDIPYAITEFRTNAESVITCLLGLAGRFELQGNGVIAVIGSVAGDRGRASNYLYGAAKAAIDTFASGLRVRLFKHGVHVLTIKPGFVDTPMTRALSLPSVLVVSPEKVAKDIIIAVTKNKNVIYTPWFWRYIMLAIIHLPAFVFKKLKL